MSAGASDIPTDEDCEMLPDNGFSYSGDYLKKTPKKKPGKPPHALRSPYLSSLNVNPRKAAVSAWKLPRTSLCDTPGGETGSARFTSLSNHHDLRLEWDMTPEFPRHTLATRQHHHTAPNAAREKEEMHNEITLLKKSLQEQKSDNQKMKVKLRRLEEDNAKREKQLEELLDPTNRSEYIRSLVDKKHEGSVVANGLKQRILKLEQQCRERENAIGNLQSELRATNLQEMRMTVKNYFEEIQRLKLLLEDSEKSGMSESRVFRRQQKALSSTVLRLSEDLKQLQLDNASLREELDTESPASGIKGYKEWSKYRLLRRLLELEKRLEERNALKARNRLEQACQTTPTNFVHRGVQTMPRQLLDLAVQTTPMDSVDAGTETADEDDVSALRGRVELLEAETMQLQETLTNKDEEVRRLMTQQEEAEEKSRRQHHDEVGELRKEKEELEKRLERWRREQTSERELEQRRHQEEVEQLRSEKEKEVEQWRCQLEIEQRQYEQELRQLGTLVQTLKEERNDPCDAGTVQDEADEDDDDKEEEEEHERLKPDPDIHTNKRKYKSQALQVGDRTNLLDGGALDEFSLVSIQAAFRGHLARTQHIAQSSGSFTCVNHLPRGASSEFENNTTAASAKRRSDEEEAPRPVSRTHRSLTSSKALDAGDLDAYSEDLDISDDSDDIIVAESYPRRNREARIL
ncbi:IQ domain-containing protein E [Phycodurus eques]|uniref:IQ domain-containing protein E n=1 Tax=Phycodurus eques TaxID=693459 RepID=UPI002ACDA45F|nr:IQ domain-containing protein E [Phycodurus eques]XP_061536365.1 IQ domain-containing protein E [Phycodurus eques]